VNLLEYIDEEFGGNQSAFAKAQKVKPLSMRMDGQRLD
jgi:hypothetical protein